MSTRTRKAAAYVVAPVALFALWAWKTGYLFPEPSLDPSPAAILRGERVFKERCLSCHEAIPIAPRVAGWTPEYAFDAVAHLPELQPAMPPFKGTEQEQADLALYLAAQGATVSPEEAAAQREPGWRPPAFEPPRAPAAGPEQR